MMSRPESIAVAVQPENGELGTCPACQGMVWRVSTASGEGMLLDTEPDPRGNHEAGTVEMALVNGEWRAEQLAQVECLFEVDRPRWRPHCGTCPRSRPDRTDGMPTQRRGNRARRAR